MTTAHRPYAVIKRGVDVIVASAGLIVLSPVIGATAVLVRAKFGSPILFKQARPGLDGKIFTLYKFRSMLDVDESARRVTNEQRSTPFGRWLRSTSLDELPSLVNVVKGDMSIVGPRPLRVEYLSRYSPEQARRHEVRPGVTGLAQIRGRNDISWDRRFEYDVQYVDKYNAFLDIRIIFATFFTVFKRVGIVGDRVATKTAFVGKHPEDGLTELPLDESWLETRVEWLKHPIIRKGITITFVPNMETSVAWFNTIKDSAERRDWVYINEKGEPVAMAGLSGVGDTEVQLYLYVHPEKHGLGYGRTVIRRLILNSLSFGADVLSLEVKENNAHAISLYERSGFSLVGQHRVDENVKRKYAIKLKDIG